MPGSLFTTQIFEQILKIHAKRDLKSHCGRRALTAAPLEETGESGSVVRYLRSGENGETARTLTKFGLGLGNVAGRFGFANWLAPHSQAQLTGLVARWLVGLFVVLLAGLLAGLLAACLPASLMAGSFLAGLCLLACWFDGSWLAGWLAGF